MAIIITPRRREDFFDQQGNPTHRFIAWIELVTGQTNETTTTVTTVESQIGASDGRIEAVEIDLSTRPRMSDIFKSNQRVDELIDELIEELQKLNTGSEAQKASVEL